MTAKPQPKTYRELRAELDDVLLKLQDPACDIDDAIKLYEQGLAVSKALQANLKQASNTIDTLTV